MLIKLKKFRYITCFFKRERFHCCSLDGEEKEQTNPSNTVSNLIPDISKEESSKEYSDKNDQVLTKKRRSFIPVESNLKEVVVSETKHKRAETEKNEQSGDTPSVTSGDSEDSNNEKASEKTEQPEESGESGTDG